MQTLSYVVGYKCLNLIDPQREREVYTNLYGKCKPSFYNDYFEGSPHTLNLAQSSRL